MPWSAAGAAECGGEPDTMGGLARCLAAIARAAAPSVLVGFHASAWAAGFDAFIDNGPDFDLLGHADESAAWLETLGAGQADLVVVEMSDRDAGFNGRFWDATNATRPNFHDAFAWVERVGTDLGLPSLFWQVPYGHMGMPNDCDHYEDNRVDYVFDHPDELSAAGCVGVAFGAGTGCMTTPASDGGHFVERAGDYFAGGGTALCLP